MIWKDFQKGQCSSPFLQDGAFAKSANIDISRSGIARINYLPVKEADTTALCRQISKDPAESTHAYGSFGSTIYKSTNSGDSFATTSGGTGNYFSIWKNYLLSFGGTDIDYYGALSGTPSWTADWKTDLQDTSEHFAYVSKNDGYLYFCNGRYVGLLEEDTTFDPSSGATYTISNTALTLPQNYQALCLAEQRENLLIGAIEGQTAGPVQQASVFIWDRERKEYDYQVTVPENAINAMYTLRDDTFISAGQRGRIYLFSEAGLVPFIQLPFDYDAGAKIDVNRHAMGEWNGYLVVGIESQDGLNPSGVYLIDTDTRKIHSVLTPSSGEDGSNDILSIGAVLGYDADNLMFSWQDNENSDFGLDRIVADNATQYRRTGYASYMESPFWSVGTKLAPVNYSQIEVQLARPLQTGEGVRLKYRTDINGSWTTIDTIDYSTNGAVSSAILDGAIYGVENIQLRVELTTGASSANTPWLKEIRLI